MFAYFIVRQRWRREEEETRLMYKFVENIIGRLTRCCNIVLAHVKSMVSNHGVVFNSAYSLYITTGQS